VLLSSYSCTTITSVLKEIMLNVVLSCFWNESCILFGIVGSSLHGSFVHGNHKVIRLWWFWKEDYSFHVFAARPGEQRVKSCPSFSRTYVSPITLKERNHASLDVF
jgi:hypothetical protein